ncbi:GDSL family lipase [Actinoplanes sp. LDG1-06]|uniref:GDSL family lipase n=1 Tax=Paractinoplanes ovalisporus TaxID=2810368 RepID=A0ABS2A6U3_9ACTN|nr:SGNH/GDSL hydrolase family protein [Actinoplanes ovalisporus]MBM2615569.1 GDSL family lipase [Actinoplanes ovalisporus]
MNPRIRTRLSGIVLTATGVLAATMAGPLDAAAGPLDATTGPGTATVGTTTVGTATVGATTGWLDATTGPGPAATMPGPLVAGAGPGTPTSAAPAAVPLKVMPLGDSITWGSGSADSRVGNRTGALTAGGYRIDLRARLAAAGLDVDFVGSRQAGPPGTDRDNEGHPGWRIDQIAANVDGWLATYRPDVVLLHIGTNDMAQNRSVAASAARLSALIDQIRAARPDAAIFVQKLVQGHVEPEKSRIAAYNTAIPGIVATKDDNVHLVDQSSIGGLSEFDDLHPNDDGYAKMAFNLYRAMAGVYGDGGWPTGSDPYAATTRTLCFRINRTVAGEQTWHAQCDLWTRHTGTGRNAAAEWKRPAPATGKRAATRWLSDDPYVSNLGA